MRRALLLFLFSCFFTLFSFAQNKGYELTLDGVGSLGVSYLSKYNVGASIINGYRFNNKFSVGIGIGFRYAETLYYYSEDSTLGNYESRDNKFLLPVFLHAKFNFTDGSISPFIVGDIGYTVDIGQNKNKNLEALFVEPIVGIDFKSEKTVWFLGLGANVQQHHYTYFHISDKVKSSDRTVKGVAPTLSLHFGVQF